MNLKNIAIIIPAYNPPQDLFNFIQNLLNSGFKKIVIINDGSSQNFNKTFENIKNLQINLITHEKNLGKGQALKTGMQFCLDNYQNLAGVITVDADGQHLIQDIKKIATKATQNKLILGKRYFNLKHVPIKSRLGNFLSRSAISFVSKQKIYDTQTGLRFIPTEKLYFFTQIPGARYEYETNMLLYAKKYNLEISEEAIETVYINNNKSSHFKPLKDAYSIYRSIFDFYINEALTRLKSGVSREIRRSCIQPRVKTLWFSAKTDKNHEN